MVTLKEQHEKFIAKVKASGKKTLKYTTPCCSNSVEDRAADKGESWDTLATCPHCFSIYMKVSTADAITASLVELN